MIDEKSLCTIFNQIFDIDKKTKKIENHTIGRNIDRILEELENSGYKILNPLGETYTETRTDCEASISGKTTDNLVITEVIKPIILKIENGFPSLLQKGVVIVEGK